MDIIHTNYKKLKGRDGYTFNTDEAKERVSSQEPNTLTIFLTKVRFFPVFFQQLAMLREQAKAITNMAATVPYRMPGDVSSRLVQTEILMH